MLFGMLIALGSALAAGVLYADAGERRPVLALADAVAAGQTIEDTDLRQVMVAVEDDLAVVPAGDRRAIVGRTATVPLAAGSLLTADQVGDSNLLDPSDAVFGAVLAEGTFPSGLRPGDSVLLFELPTSGSEARPTDGVRATVVDVRDADAPGAANVTIGVTPADAGRMAVAAGLDRLIVVLAPR